MKSRFLVILAAIALLSSCKSSKDFVYLQDMELGRGYDYDASYEPSLAVNDLLSITVSCKNPELAIPFNAAAGAFSVGGNGTVAATGVAPQGGYRVDVDGNITFPILGKLRVAGLKVSQATDLIRSRIMEGQYIKDPLVQLEITNFKYSVLGATGTGVFNVDGGRITLLEAVAKSGDITDRGRVNRVGVIREENGRRVMYMHDLRSKDIFQSPCYYLKQNDIVYVEPKYQRKDKEDKAWQYVTTALSVVTAACSVIWATKR